MSTKPESPLGGKPLETKKKSEITSRRHLTRLEVLGFPESELTLSLVTVAGDTFTGKTGLAERLAKRLKFPKASTFLVGQRMRETEKAGQGAQGFIPRDLAIDKAFDLRQDDIISDATTEKPALLESRLAALKAKRIRPLDSVSILLLASEGERKRRAVRRTTDDLNKRINEVKKRLPGETNPIIVEGDRFVLATLRDQLATLDADEIWEQEKGRESGDEDRYRELYPWFNEIKGGYMDPELTDENGRPIYDIVVMTGGHEPEAVYNLVCEAIIKFRQDKEDIKTIVNTLEKPEETVVFEESAEAQPN
jgi:cytidylate kinase